MIEFISDIMGSGGIGTIAGGLFGGVFGWLNRREDRMSRAKDQDFELRRLEAQSKADTQTSEARAFEQSQVSVSAVGDAIKSAVRPLITGLLLFMMLRLILEMEEITGGIASFPVDILATMYNDIIMNVITLTAICVSWWFASRPSGISHKIK